LDIFNTSITLGHHPWSDALVVIIPKPAKPDYHLPRAYRPISLLECCSKLLEKIIAKHILSDSHHHDILPNTQFGSHDYHCTTDAALCLVHNAQAAVWAGFTASVVLFDIQGFFDNINIDRIIHIFHNLGFPLSLCSWLRSFLSNRCIRLSFNGFKSDPIILNHGTPQGSPLSPILSAIYTSPLLKHLNSSWVHRGLNMYVNDGAIFANAKTHSLSSLNATRGLQEITEWLGRSGLKCDTDKTEFISFSPPRSMVHINGPLIPAIHPHTSASSSYTVERSSIIRYLGIFIHHRFDWTHHVTIIANHARSTIRALSILGNSVWGLDYANWHKIFHSLILPILTYGFPLYSTLARNKGLMDILQVAQNDAIRKMSGAFKTTPIVPLHYLMAIPPITLTLSKLTDVFRLHVQRLPPFTLIHTLTTFNPATDWHLSLNPPTPLTRLLPNLFPPFNFPSPIYKSIWTHPRVRDNTIIALSRESKEATKELIRTPSYNTFHLFVRLLTIPSPPFAASFLLFCGQTLIHHGVMRDSSRPRALFAAVCQGLTYAPLSNHIHIFLPDLSLLNYLFHLHKHALLDLSRSFTLLLSNFLSTDPMHHIDIFRYSIKWSGLLGMAQINSLSEEQQLIVFPLPPPSLVNPKARLLCLFQDQYDLLRHDSRIWQSIIQPDGKPPPFYLGALHHKDRHTSSSAVQLAFDHAFTCTYSQIFRTNTDDTLWCLCHGTPLPSCPSLPLSEQASFDHLMAIQHANPCLTVSPDPSRASLSRPQRLTLSGRRHSLQLSPRVCYPNLTYHVLFECSPLSSPCRQIFGPFPFDAYIFGTFDGGFKLGKFQRATNRLLRPLPPRPDPP